MVRSRRPRQPMPAQVADALRERGLHDAYESRPPYQRNDYLLWINAARRESTRLKRIEQMLAELEQGDIYMRMDWPPGRRGG